MPTWAKQIWKIYFRAAIRQAPKRTSSAIGIQARRIIQNAQARIGRVDDKFNYTGAAAMGARFPFNSAYNAIQLALPIQEELIVDLFAGGGGASYGIEMALGRRVDVAINHNPVAVSLHQRNHPDAIHLCEDLKSIHPRDVTRGRKVALLHGSPDCRDHSQSKGGQPRSKEIRGLSWQMLKWAGTVTPTIITMENVRQIKQWGPLIAKRDKVTGRVMKLDRSVAAPGERVPVQEQFLIPDPKRLGRTWGHFTRGLQSLGYDVETNMLNAANYDTPTTRNRLFLVARRDGMQIVWPTPTHAKLPEKGQKPWRSAAECIDWSIESKSIFTRKKPLADATLKRIATGIVDYVLNSNDPYFVPADETGDMHSVPVMTECANASNPRCMPAGEPARTICASTKGGHLALISPTLVQAGHGDGTPGRVRRWGKGVKSVQEPVGAVTASGGGGQAVASAFLVQANGGYNATPALPLTRPATTVTAAGSQQQLVTATLVTLRNNCDSQDARVPVGAVTASGQHHGVSEQTLAPEYDLTSEQEEGALRVAAFLVHYYSEGGQWSDLRDPAPTVTTRHRLALVTVHVRGTPYVIVDVRFRMLTPRELARCQGFPDSYIIDCGDDGRRLTNAQQTHAIGNSVCPPMMKALIAANAPHLMVGRRKAA